MKKIHELLELKKLATYQFFSVWHQMHCWC